MCKLFQCFTDGNGSHGGYENHVFYPLLLGIRIQESEINTRILRRIEKSSVPSFSGGLLIGPKKLRLIRSRKKAASGLFIR